MRISTKGRYGLRAMIDLALHQGEGPVMMRAITERQGIPRKYLHALLTSLRKAELVRSVRGSRGGYVLARDPSRISAREVVEALEGRIKLVDCRERGSLCKMYGSCKTRRLWADLGHMLAERLGQTSLSELANGKGPAGRRRVVEEKASRRPPARSAVRAGEA